MKKEERPIIVEQIFDVPIERVWAAITEASQMRQWFFDSLDVFRVEVASRPNSTCWLVIGCFPTVGG